MSSAGRIEFAILGPLQMAVDQRPTNLGGGTPRALLAMLLLHYNSPVRTDALMAGLWGEDVPASATNSLHSHISRLRRLIGESDGTVTLERQAAGYALCGDPDRLDATRFERLARGATALASRGERRAAVALLREGLALWRGPALEDLSGAEFARGAAVRLDETRLEATAQTIDLELELGTAGGLIAELESLVAEHPMQERFWGQLMVALYREGRQADALGAYHRARRVLDAELGVEPSAALRRLEELILRQAPELEAPVAQPAVAARTQRSTLPPSAAVFVGREAELSALADAFSATDRGLGGLVVVEAGAGMGKTALVERFAADCAAAGATVCVGRAREEVGGAPYWPWIEVLRSRAEQAGQHCDPTTVDLAELVLGGEVDAVRDPRQARLRLYDAVARRLTDQGEPPLLIVLEDMHAGDESSLRLLQFLLRQPSARLLVVLTQRPVKLESPAVEVVVEAARAVEVRHLALPPLDEAEIRAYLGRSLGSSAPAEVVEATVRRTEGHPFFLTEIVRMLRVRPASTKADAFDIPRTVSEMIGRRFACLPDETLRMLLAASVLGREFDLRMLARVAAIDVDSVLDRVEEAAGEGLVQDVGSTGFGYRFDHALTHQTLYARLPGTRRVVLHARAADAIEAGLLGPVAAHLSEIAHHRCASVAESGVVEAVAAAGRAGDAATSALAYEEAVRLHVMALDAHERHGGEPQALFGLVLAVGHALGRTGRPEEAREAFLSAASLARADADADRLGAVALGLGAAFDARIYDADLVLLLDEALAGLSEDRAELRARLLARLAMALNLHDPDGRAPTLSAAALRIARELGDSALEALCLSARSFALWGPDHQSEWRQCALDTVALAERLDDSELALDGLAFAICADLERADRAGATGRLARHARLAIAVRHPLHLYYGQLWQASFAALDGRAAEAVDLAEGAATLGEPLAEMTLPRRTALKMVALRDLGRLADGLADADAMAARFPLLPSWRTGPAWVRMHLGDLEPARVLLRELPDKLDAVFPREGNWIVAMQVVAELTVGVEDATRAAGLRDALLPHAGRFGVLRFAPVSWGPVDRHLGSLAALVQDWDAAERHFRRAIELADGLGAPTYVAYSECDWARMLLRRGRPGDAAAAHRLIGAAAGAAERLGLAGLQAHCDAVSKTRTGEEKPT